MSAMGTSTINKAIHQHWEVGDHPIYCSEIQHYSHNKPTVMPRPKIIRARYLVFVAGLFIWLGLLAQFLTGRSSLIATMICEASLLIPAIGILTIIYILPLAAAVGTSATIAREREQQTWDVLLTTALDWPDIMLAKIAAVHHRLRRGLRVMRWVQIGMGSLVFLALVSSFTSSNGGLRPAEVLVALLAAFQFAIERLQDVILGSLIGLAVSLVVTTRSGATVSAVVVAAILPILRSVIAAILIGMLPILPVSVSAGLPFLLIIAPTSTLALSLPLGAAALALIAIPLLYEAAIILLFRWLSRHLGEAQHPLIAQL